MIMNNENAKASDRHAFMRENCAKNLGKILRYYRNCRNVSQDMVAEATGMNHSYYCCVEKGKANVSLLKFIIICDSLQVSPEKILRDLCHFDEEDARFKSRR